MNPRRSASGFTLIEIVVTVGLIALVMGFLLTRLGGGFGVHLRNAGRSLAAELEYAGQRAIATGRPQRFLVDFDTQAFRLEELPKPAEVRTAELPDDAEKLDLSVPLLSMSYVPVDNAYGSWHWLSDEEVVINELRLGADSSRAGEASIGFSPDGGADPAELLLLDDAGYELKLRVVAFTGEIRVEELPR